MERIVSLILCFLFLFSVVVGANTEFEPYQDELEIMNKIKNDANPIYYWQLSQVRLKHAARLYQSWQNNGDAKDFQRALIYAESASDLQPDWDEAWLLEGMLYAELKSDHKALEKAVAALIRAVDINPANGRAQMILAQLLMEQGRFWSAIEQYQSLIAKNKAMQNGTIISQLTFCYIADGRVQAGRDYIERLLKDEQYEGDKDWLKISRAVLFKAQGDKGQAVNILESSLNNIKEVEKSDSAKVKEMEYLLKRWNKAVTNKE